MVGDAGPGPSVATRLLAEMWGGLGGGLDTAVPLAGEGSVPSVYPASDLAQAAVAVAGLALAELVATVSGTWPALSVDRRLASAWFVSSYRPLGWTTPPQWDPIGGDFLAGDGWIRLHTNNPHHRKVVLDVLGVGSDRDAVAGAVASWNALDLEDALVGAGGAAAAMHTVGEWAAHPQGAAVTAEPLVHRHAVPLAGAGWGVGSAGGARPLAGLKVLDLTRILAGPVATRFLAGFGAQVLRIDPPGWDEPPLVTDVTPGKRCALLDLRDAAGRRRLLDLLASADVIVHGYRPGALERLGLGEAVRREVRPGIVDVSLDAYGWSGPWAGRRGFDSLVQMSSGIAATGMLAAGADRPVPLPFQALDHATGYLLAASALRGLTLRIRDGLATTWRASLARTAALLTGAASPDPAAGRDPAGGPGSRPAGGAGAAAGPGSDLAGAPGSDPAAGRRPAAGERGRPAAPAPLDIDPAGLAGDAAPVEHTVWGDLRRLPSPVRVGGHGLAWDTPATPFGAGEARW